MNLDRALADAQFIGDHLVRLARNDEIEYLTLTIGQPAQALVHLGMLLLFLATFFVGRQRLTDAVEQFLVTKRLLDEINGAFLHSLDGHRHVAVTRDEDDRERVATLDQFLLEFESTESGHADVQHQATWPLFRYLLEKLVT